MHILGVTAVSALNVKRSRLGRCNGSADDDTGHPDEARNCERVEIADRDILGVGVQKQLVFWKIDLGRVREYDSVSASLESCLEQGDDFRGFRHQPVGDLLVELDQVANVYVAVVFLEERILTQLISGDEVR